MNGFSPEGEALEAIGIDEGGEMGEARTEPIRSLRRPSLLQSHRSLKTGSWILCYPDMEGRGREQIASGALHLGTDIHFMPTNELRASLVQLCVALCLFFQPRRMEKGENKLGEQQVLPCSC